MSPCSAGAIVRVTLIETPDAFCCFGKRVLSWGYRGDIPRFWRALECAAFLGKNVPGGESKMEASLQNLVIYLIYELHYCSDNPSDLPDLLRWWQQIQISKVVPHSAACPNR